MSSTLTATHVYRCPHCGDERATCGQALISHRCPNNRRRETVYKEQTTEGNHPQ